MVGMIGGGASPNSRCAEQRQRFIGREKGHAFLDGLRGEETVERIVVNAGKLAAAFMSDPILWRFTAASGPNPLTEGAPVGQIPNGQLSTQLGAVGLQDATNALGGLTRGAGSLTQTGGGGAGATGVTPVNP